MTVSPYFTRMESIFLKTIHLFLKDIEQDRWPIVYTYLKTSEASIYGNNHKGQDKDRTNPIYPWILFQPNTKNFPEGDKEWELTHMDRPQNSTIIKASTSKHCNRPRAYGLEKNPSNLQIM